jgi:hypothetical protein
MKTAAPHRAPPVTARTQRGVTLTAFAAFLCCCRVRSTQGAGGRKRHAGVDRGMDNATTLCCRLTFMRHVQPRSHLPRTRSKACCRLSIMPLYCRVLQNQDCSSSLYCRVLRNQDCSSPLYCRVPRNQDCSSSLYCRVPRHEDCSSPPRSARDRTHTTQGTLTALAAFLCCCRVRSTQGAEGRWQGAGNDMPESTGEWTTPPRCAAG